MIVRPLRSARRAAHLRSEALFLDLSLLTVSYAAAIKIKYWRIGLRLESVRIRKVHEIILI
mgnify:CR=1 FL=1